jgi:hypothetical protein
MQTSFSTIRTVRQAGYMLDSVGSR